MASGKRAAPLRAQIVALAKGGDGVASVVSTNGYRSLLVPRTVPGDVVDVVEEKSGKGRLLRVLEPSARRVQPPCPYTDTCGGCDWMHIDLDTQRSARPTIVGDEMHRAGVPVPEIAAHPAEQTLRYRARARLAILATPRAVVVGFRAPRSHRVVPVDTCLVLVPELDEARGELAAWLAGSVGVGEASLCRGHGGRPAIHLAWEGTLHPRVFAHAEQQVERGRWAGVSVLLDGATAPATLGDARGVTLGGDGLPLVVPPGGFMQAHEQMNGHLVRHVEAIAGIDGEPVLELFAGSGNFTVALARRTDALETVEQSAAAVDAARENLEGRGLKVRLHVGDAEGARVRPGVRTVVLDPPRAGARGAVERIAASRVRTVVMVSCDPATLARDASILLHKGRFALERLDVFEMFPCTSHVEAVALFRRER
jgi:23S rRNA (uracil1939-C5)-methyltransferase